MIRALFVAALVLIGAAVLDARPAKAAKSSKNPYSSFNISGINYGAQRWNREHSGSSNSSRRSGTLFRRR